LSLRRSKKTKIISKKVQDKTSVKEKPNTKKRQYTKRANCRTLPEVATSATNIKKKVDPKSRWIIVELSDDITFSEYSDAIEYQIKKELGTNVEYYIPLYREQIQDKAISFVLFEGYFFIKFTEDILSHLDELHSEYIKGPLRKNSQCREISGKKINDFNTEIKKKLRNLMPKKKQRVVPKIGVFSNLEGEVISVDKKKLIAMVKFEYATRVVEAPINFINLDIID